MENITVPQSTRLRTPARTPTKRPVSSLAASPLRASVVPKSNENSNEDVNNLLSVTVSHKDDRRASASSYMSAIRWSGNSTRAQSREFREFGSKDSLGSIAVSSPRSDRKAKAVEVASRSSSIKSKSASPPAKIGDSFPPDQRDKGRASKSIADQLKRKTSRNRDTDRQLHGFKIIEESRELQSISSIGMLDTFGDPRFDPILTPVVLWVKPILQLTNPDDTSVSPQGTINRQDTIEIFHPPTSQIHYNFATESVKQLLYITAPKIEAEEVESRFSGIFDSMVLGGSIFADGEDVQTAGTELHRQESLQDRGLRSDRMSVASFERESFRQKKEDGVSVMSDGESSRMTKLKSKTIMTKTASGGKKEIGWGKLFLVWGIIRAAVTITIEGYICYNVWKFIDSSWGDLSGTLQHNLVYFALFIFAKMFVAVSIVDAACHKNSMQLILCIVSDIGILAFSIIQINLVNNIQSCADNFVAVYQNGFPHLIANNTMLASSDGLNTFDLMGSCPWLPDSTAPSRFIQYSPYLARAKSLEMVILGITGFGTFVGILLGYKTYQEYGWSMYQVQGASIQRKWIMTRYHLFVLLLKLNIFFTIGFVTLLVASFYYTQKGIGDLSIALNTAWSISPASPLVAIKPTDHTNKASKDYLVPASIVAVITATGAYSIGWNAIRKCNRTLMLIFLAFLVVDFAAVVYGLAVASDSKYQTTKASLATFCSLQIIINLITWVVGLQNIRDFMNGLSDMLYQSGSSAIDAKKIERNVMLD